METREELQRQIELYQEHEIKEKAKADRFDYDGIPSPFYELSRAEYFHGKVDGIREALRAYEERGL